jgi:hypothetical protein
MLWHWPRVNVMQLYIMPFLPASCHFLSDQNNMLSTLFSNIPCLCTSLNVRDFSHPHETIVRITVIHILIFMVLDSSHEDKTFYWICHNLAQFRRIVNFVCIKILSSNLVTGPEHIYLMFCPFICRPNRKWKNNTIFPQFWDVLFSHFKVSEIGMASRNRCRKIML